jgi:hypothetical protein
MLKVTLINHTPEPEKNSGGSCPFMLFPDRGCRTVGKFKRRIKLIGL